MKVTSHTTLQSCGDVPAQRFTPGTAFDQTLRNMEKDMWNGASAGHMPTSKLPSAPIRQSVRGIAAITDFADTTPDFFHLATSRSKSGLSAAERETAGTEATGTPMSEPRQMSSEPAAFVASSISLSGFPIESRTATFDRASSNSGEVAPTSEPPNRGALPLSPPSSEPPPTCRVTVFDSAKGMTVALRTNDTTPEQTSRISRAALHELRRHGVHGANIVVNGVQQTIGILEEEQHGH